MKLREIRKLSDDALRAAARLLAHRQCMLRMRREARIVDTLDRWVALEQPRYCEGRGVLLLDADGNDIYDAYQYCQGAGIHLSTGALIDWNGDDSYRAHAICHSSAHDYSVGMLIERAGNDKYAGDLAGKAWFCFAPLDMAQGLIGKALPPTGAMLVFVNGELVENISAQIFEFVFPAVVEKYLS